MTLNLYFQQLNDLSIWLKSLGLLLLLIVVAVSHRWTVLVMTQEEEEKFLIHILEWLQQIIAMDEIPQDAKEMEDHFQTLGMRHIYAAQ